MQHRCKEVILPKREVLAYGALAVGAYFLYRGFTGFHFSFLYVFVGFLLLALGWKYKPIGQVRKPFSIPADFNATHWNKNIALNANTGALWVRDKSGQTATFGRSDLLGWEMKNSVFKSTAVAGPRDTPMDNELLVKAKSIDKPVWTVQFNAHSSLTGRGNHDNHQELRDWYERLNAVYNH